MHTINDEILCIYIFYVDHIIIAMLRAKTHEANLNRRNIIIRNIFS